MSSDELIDTTDTQGKGSSMISVCQGNINQLLLMRLTKAQKYREQINADLVIEITF
jgi:hypothetical protein